MTIELGNRLADLRKQHGYSQEDLADKLGVSRPAISKWERGEASPDTDNLIELAKIYDISLDELLGLKSKDDATGEKESKSTININITSGKGKSRKNDEDEDDEDEDEDDDDDDDDEEDDDDDDHVRITKDGIDVTDGKDSVRISKDGVHVRKGEKVVHINGDVNIDVDNEIKVRAYRRRANRITAIASLLTVFGTVITYILLGTLLDLWAQAWVLFLLIPVVPSLCKAIEHRNPNMFAYPVFVAFIYLLLCCWILNFSLWHPLWVIFLTIPIYHGTIAAFRK